MLYPTEGDSRSVWIARDRIQSFDAVGQCIDACRGGQRWWQIESEQWVIDSEFRGDPGISDGDFLRGTLTLVGDAVGWRHLRASIGGGNGNDGDKWLVKR